MQHVLGRNLHVVLSYVFIGCTFLVYVIPVGTLLRLLVYYHARLLDFVGSFVTQRTRIPPGKVYIPIHICYNTTTFVTLFVDW